MGFSLQARIVFPVDRPAIEHGFVTIDGERIVAVGNKAESGELIDLGSVALLPGLVNAHTHLEFSHLRQPLGEPGMRLVDWIRLVIAERGRGDSDASAAIDAGIAESVHAGPTTIGDIAGRTDVLVRPSLTDGQGCPSYELIDATVFAEVIGFSRARAESAYDAISERLDAIVSHPHAHAHAGISPHAPYTVSPDLLRKLIALARQRNLRVAMHVAESTDELELLRSGKGPFQELLEERSMWDAAAIPHGSRPLDYLRMLAEAPRSLVIHGNYFDDQEQSFLAANRDRMSLVYCPRTHRYFGHPPYPLAQFLNSGVRVALGTDSRASNPDLNLLSEMRYVARNSPTLDPQTILRMGTLAGAEALGRADEAGSITPGKLAHLVAVPLPAEARGTAQDLLSALLADCTQACAVWLRGRKWDANFA